jgi:4-hydroxy-4-methyl-2-oxoglutarate aldolase
MDKPLTPEQLESLRALDACTLANAIETFNRRLRNEGFTDQSLCCLFPELPPIVGYAATIKIRGSVPPFADGRPYPNRTDWWDYVLSLPAPRILVVEDDGPKTGLGSLLGAVQVHILRVLGCVGAVTNGSVRDIPDLENLGFQIFAGGICVSHAYVHIVEFGAPVHITGLKIHSGDLLHGDLHGVQNVPLNIAGKVPGTAAEIIKARKKIIDLCESKDSSVEKLRAAVGTEHL